ncbi:carbohydrate-binding protein SusD [Mucilaginibacter sp. PPCGB 2223]|uniref:RagB/SusD family nutrient uptake outer membrane protein n=1 Tax=Mucilaginibacter sp. PPCGB 2223 TaxID=1886027 RepID=UPI000824A4EF|nr:RagB/SusD family nutrient uptake outer membrane protein [Mucilaginibacter sp. PPCGB 2223]OCX52241.1 carbohydrate-binding protein SusD [Mucilaginibacter sp. PPCGB 2223]
MKKKIIFLLGLVVLSTYSCQKDQLYQPLPTSISNQDGAPFSTAARISAQVTGLYAPLRSGQLYGGRFQIYNDIKADNWINSTNNSVTGLQTWNGTIQGTSSEALNLWAQCYTAINDCNLFIDGMKTYGTAVVGTAVAANYVGEAQFLRAISYYALLDMYCQAYSVSSGATPGVPLRLTGNSAYGDFSAAPATVAQVYAQIISDLNAAEASLPISYGTDATSNTIRASRNTAIAFKTRIYLAMGQYNNVITEANKIVTATAPFTATTGVAYALQANIANVFKSPYTTTESVFSEPFTTTEAVGSQNALADYFNTTGATEYYINPSSALFTDVNWKATDARRGFIKTTGTKMNLTKWSLGSPYLDWANVMRYSEVLLNLAEARVKINGASDAQAIALLNAVRQRSDPTTVFTTADLPSIYQERNIEFLGEGLRWADLLRLGLPIPAKGTITAIPVGGFGSTYIWPMSNAEQLNNPLIGR